jgi:hypothetical protein
MPLFRKTMWPEPLVAAAGFKISKFLLTDSLTYGKLSEHRRVQYGLHAIHNTIPAIFAAIS